MDNRFDGLGGAGDYSVTPLARLIGYCTGALFGLLFVLLRMAWRGAGQLFSQGTGSAKRRLS
jgi:hypothetical protein